MIIYILGKMLGVEGVVLLIPALVSLIYCSRGIQIPANKTWRNSIKIYRSFADRLISRPKENSFFFYYMSCS